MNGIFSKNEEIWLMQIHKINYTSKKMYKKFIKNSKSLLTVNDLQKFYNKIRPIVISIKEFNGSEIDLINLICAKIYNGVDTYNPFMFLFSNCIANYTANKAYCYECSIVFKLIMQFCKIEIPTLLMYGDSTLPLSPKHIWIICYIDKAWRCVDTVNFSYSLDCGLHLCKISEYLDKEGYTLNTISLQNLKNTNLIDDPNAPDLKIKGNYTDILANLTVLQSAHPSRA